MPGMDTLAKRLAHAREAAGLTQGQLSAKSGVAQSDISKIENGQILRPTSTVALSKALGCNPFWLDDGSGDPRQMPGWPFEHFSQEEYRRFLTPAERSENEALLWGKIMIAQKKNGTAP